MYQLMLRCIRKVKFLNFRTKSDSDKRKIQIKKRVKNVHNKVLGQGTFLKNEIDSERKMHNSELDVYRIFNFATIFPSYS